MLRQGDTLIGRLWKGSEGCFSHLCELCFSILNLPGLQLLIRSDSKLHRFIFLLYRDAGCGEEGVYTHGGNQFCCCVAATVHIAESSEGENTVAVLQLSYLCVRICI